MDVLSGDEASLVFVCEVDGEPVAPDPTPTFTVYSITGVAIPALTDVAAQVINTNEALCIIPGAENTLSDGQPVSRFVRLTFEKDGRVLRKQNVYRIMPFLPITVTPEWINAQLLSGVGPSDENAYDIYAAYLTAKRAVPTLDDHLVGEYATEANRLIALYAARPLMSRISLSLNQREKSHDEEVERFRGIKFDELMTSLASEIMSLISVLNGTTTAEAYPAAVLTNPTDPVTGGQNA